MRALDLTPIRRRLLMSVTTLPKAAELRLPTHREPYYGGKWQKPAAGRYVEVTGPGSGESLGKVVDSSVADAEAAIAAAVRGSLRFDARKFHHLAPLLGFICDEL